MSGLLHATRPARLFVPPALNSAREEKVQWAVHCRQRACHTVSTLYYGDQGIIYFMLINEYFSDNSFNFPFKSFLITDPKGGCPAICPAMCKESEMMCVGPPLGLCPAPNICFPKSKTSKI